VPYLGAQVGARMLKIGSLCTGYGGLDIAAEAYFQAETVWVSEFDKYASKVVEARINKPNFGNLKVINWQEMEPIDILTAGYPCQPFSHAGLRKGAEDERHLWPYIKTAISVLRPRYVVLENVRGHFGLGFREVLGDLTSIGYDARWTLIRASDVGAPHRRERLFILAYPNSARWSRAKPSDFQETQPWNSSRDTYEYPNTDGQRWSLVRDRGREVRYKGEPQPLASKLVEAVIANTDGIPYDDARREHRDIYRAPGQEFNRSDRFKPRFSLEMASQAVPSPLDEGKLNVKFVEYMMGLPDGWVTDVDLPRSQKLKILGNGVVPQQAYRALELLNGE
jgi:DNA (cytosine-5)-methyltransferase 1